MSDEAAGVRDTSSPFHYVLLGIAGIYVIASLFLLYNLNDRVNTLQVKQAALEADLGKRVATSESRTEALAAKMGVTAKELSARTAHLQREQRASETRLAEQQKQVGEVSGAVAGVKTEVGAVKTDVASTKSELEATKMKLERAIGDLGQQSGLIARTRDELDWLKHRGDKNYFEFTLQKGKSAVPVSTVSLQLKKTDAKKGKFSMNVLADDRTIEKKDRTIYEPVQFYTGRDRQLYEMVVTAVDKNTVTGYLATPKNSPEPGK